MFRFRVGDIIPSFGPNGEEHYIVVESGTNPKLEKVEDYILRCRTVYYEGEYCTLSEIIAREKKKILHRGNINV